MPAWAPLVGGRCSITSKRKGGGTGRPSRQSQEQGRPGGLFSLLGGSPAGSAAVLASEAQGLRRCRGHRSYAENPIDTGAEKSRYCNGRLLADLLRRIVVQQGRFPCGASASISGFPPAARPPRTSGASWKSSPSAPVGRWSRSMRTPALAVPRAETSGRHSTACSGTPPRARST
jgi:hypothetical protein